MTWWCSAQGYPWTWSWQAYPGVWFFVLGVVGLYAWSVTRFLTRAGVTGPPAASQRQLVYFGMGVLSLWIALDWPVGALGAGYLLSLHQVQYVLLVMVAPPLLLLGTPVWLLGSIVDAPSVRPFARFLTRPVPAILTCNAIVVFTHLPAVVDGVMTSQLGSFLVDVTWLAGGLILWWPAIRPVPELNGLSYPGRFGYLLAATLIPSIPAAFFFFADYPIYALYELAPPVGSLSARDDQFVAGIVMKMGGFVVVIFALSVLFFRWHARDRSVDDAIVLPGAVTDV